MGDLCFFHACWYIVDLTRRPLFRPVLAGYDGPMLFSSSDNPDAPSDDVVTHVIDEDMDGGNPMAIARNNSPVPPSPGIRYAELLEVWATLKTLKSFLSSNIPSLNIYYNKRKSSFLLVTVK